MAGFNGSGTYVRTYSWATDAINNIDILPDRMDTEDDGFATGLSTAICKDGQTTITADLPMATHKHTGVGNGTARTHYAALGQAQDAAYLWGGTSGGSANAQTITLTPAITAYAAGQTFRFLAGFANTSAATLNVNGVGAKAITKNGTTALTGAEIPAGALVEVVYDGTEFQLVNVAMVAYSAYSFLQNATIVASVAASALTIALKGSDGNDPSASNPVIIPFRSTTAASGDYDTLTISAALSLVVSSGSTLGTANGIPFRTWVVIFNDASTARLGIINCRKASADAVTGGIYPLSACSLSSSTAEGGAGAADSAQVIYTGTAVTTKAMRVLGYFEWSAGLATAGTWSGAPTLGCLLGPDIRMPGHVVQSVYTPSGNDQNGTTVLPFDNTIPQNTEGVAISNLDTAITPLSAANLLQIQASVFLSNSAANDVTLALFQDTTANALAANSYNADTTAQEVTMPLYYEMLSATASSTTFKLRAGGDAAGTTRSNGVPSTRKLGGVAASFLRVTEIQG